MADERDRDNSDLRRCQTATCRPGSVRVGEGGPDSNRDSNRPGR